MAQYPANIPVFSTKRDVGTAGFTQGDDILAAHPNTIQDEVVELARTIGAGVGAADPRQAAAGGAGSTIHARLVYLEGNKSASTHGHNSFPGASTFGGPSYRIDYDGDTNFQGRRNDGVPWPLYLNWSGGGQVYISDITTRSFTNQGRSYFSDGLELGQPGGTPYIDFHTSTDLNATDYDARLILQDADNLFLYSANLHINAFMRAITPGDGDWSTYPVRAEATGGYGNTGFAFSIPAYGHALIFKVFGGAPGVIQARNSADSAYAALSCSGVFTNSSLAIKSSIEDNEYGLAEIMAMESKKYTVEQHVALEGHAEIEGGGVELRQVPRIGLIAESMVDIVPEVVHVVDGSPEGIDYSALVPVLIKGMQEQQHMIEALQAEIATLKG